jgi:hypothetical protein
MATTTMVHVRVDEDDQGPSGGHTGGHGAVGVGRGADAAGPGGGGTGAAVRRAGAERRDGGGDPGAGGRAGARLESIDTPALIIGN